MSNFFHDQILLHAVNPLFPFPRDISVIPHSVSVLFVTSFSCRPWFSSRSCLDLTRQGLRLAASVGTGDCTGGKCGISRNTRSPQTARLPRETSFCRTALAEHPHIKTICSGRATRVAQKLRNVPQSIQLVSGLYPVPIADTRLAECSSNGGPYLQVRLRYLHVSNTTLKEHYITFSYIDRKVNGSYS